MHKVANIILKPLISDEYKIFNSIARLLSFYYDNGQILKKHVTFCENGKIVIRVYTTNDDSLDTKYNNKNINLILKSFEMQYEILGDDPLSYYFCECDKPSYYVLYPKFPEFILFCGDCDGAVPLTRLPYLFEDYDHFSLYDWKEDYVAAHRLYMNNVCSAEMKSQLSDFDSQLNRRGFEICKEITKKTGVPCYLYYDGPFAPFSASLEDPNVYRYTHCPKCGKELECFDSELTGQVCHNCKIAITDLSSTNNTF